MKSLFTVVYVGVTLAFGIAGVAQILTMPGVNVALAWCCGVAIGTALSFLRTWWREGND